MTEATEFGEPSVSAGHVGPALGWLMTDETEEQPHVLGAMLPPVERLVNLTEHAITVESLTTSLNKEDGAPVPSMATFTPDGRLTRIPDGHTWLDEGWINTPSGLLRETCLRRRIGSALGLPPAEPGVRYLVSRMTALAARDRMDLVFPVEKFRDKQGRVIAARGLATFPSESATRQRYRDWQRRTAERRSRRSLVGEWRTGPQFALATAFLCVWLGLLAGIMDNTLKSGLAGGGQIWTTLLSAVFFALGAITSTLAVRRWYVRQKVRADRGTAYVIEEQAIAWRHEDRLRVLGELAGGFARMLRVPGPEALGERWRWQADARGAAEWDRRTNQLVHSFWAVLYNNDQVTKNAVFVWAPWPVSMAFGVRATARRRGLVLHVRQRPSIGAMGLRHELRLTDPAHDFLGGAGHPGSDLAALAPQHSAEELTACLKVTVETLREEGEEATRQHPGDLAAFPPVRLLLVRIAQEEISGIPLNLSKTPVITLRAPRCLTDSVLRPGSHQVEVAEWRLASTGQAAEIPWKAFPAATEAIAMWIASDAEGHPGHVLLLAAQMPDEIAMGLGIRLGQQYSTWPDRLYPIYYAGGELFVPNLDLGRHSVSPELP